MDEDMDSAQINMDTITEPKPYICQGCGLSISDQYLLNVSGATWHEDCVKCESCGMQLFDRCYIKHLKLYCKSHYFKLYSPYKCCGCKAGVSPTDMVYKLKSGVLYHIACHRCFHCGKVLCPGEQIVVDESTKSVACIDHYQHLFSDRHAMERAINSNSNENIQQTPVPPTFPVNEPSCSSQMQFNYLQLDGGSYSYYGDDLSSLAAQKYLKRRGPRTTIKQNQLDVLNRIFNATPKPSKHARAKLALETGLSMRVIQVWFQNRRSKERRLKHLCNWIRENESRGIIPPISPMVSQPNPLGSILPPASELAHCSGDMQDLYE